MATSGIRKLYEMVELGSSIKIQDLITSFMHDNISESGMWED